MARRNKPGSSIKGATFLVIGIIITIGSLVLNAQSEQNKFIVFIFAGIGLILYGMFKMFSEKNKAYKAPEWSPRGNMPQEIRNAPPRQPNPEQGGQQQGFKSCGKCGTKMPTRANFCAVCGSRL